MRAKKARPRGYTFIFLTVSLTGLLLAYPQGPGGQFALAVGPQCPDGSVPPCSQPPSRPTPRPPTRPTRRTTPRQTQQPTPTPPPREMTNRAGIDFQPTPTPTPQPTPTTPPQQMTNRVGIDFVWIPAGSFTMGSQHGGEGPAHQVTISKGFYIGKNEVTQAQWQYVMGNNPSHFNGDSLPVEQVSWYMAKAFIEGLNAKDAGYTYRLPTEAEWEYACRAGTTGDYAGSVDAMAWYGNNSGRVRLDATDIWQNDHGNYWKRIADNGNQTHPVGTKQPNAFGLFDMQGNVAEWVEDWYHGSYDGAPTDGSAWLSGGEQKHRVPRGHTWYELAPRCADRGWLSPGEGGSGYGLRVVAVARQ